MGRTTMSVAGVDLGAVDLPEADAFCRCVVDASASAGVDPARLFVGTHRVAPDSGGLHVVLTLCGSGVHEWQLWRLCLAALQQRPALAATVGRQALGDVTALAAARAAIDERTRRIAGRCVHFPGVEHLTGTMSAARILEVSAIDAVVEVGGAAVDATVEVDTGGHVRPRWEFGSLTLHVLDDAAGHYRPFEAPRRAEV